jgi:CDP-4-dehydro-6-deoxyglucose reductase
VNEVIAKVNKVELINRNVYQVSLDVPVDSFIAGQYLMIHLPSGESVPYSIGSAPHELPSLQLYILVADETSLAFKVISYLQDNETINLKIPGGDCHIDNGVLSDAVEQVLLVAGGTGFAQMKSMYDALTQQNYQGKVSLYWGVRTPEDSFLNDWIATKNNISLVVNEADTDWQGATGWLYEKIVADNPDLNRSVAFVSGSPGMVYGTLDQLEAAGLAHDASFSDVFAYAPRPEKPQL